MNRIFWRMLFNFKIIAFVKEAIYHCAASKPENFFLNLTFMEENIYYHFLLALDTHKEW